MSSTRFATMSAIMGECITYGLDLPAQVAYVLATVDHETNRTFQPVREAYWLKNSDAWLRKNHPEYYPYYGRGYVQLTWRHNYQLYETLLGIPLVENPDLALEEATARFILVHGMAHGMFTQQRLIEFINTEKTDFYHARQVVNGMNKARTVAKLAISYYIKLQELEEVA